MSFLFAEGGGHDPLLTAWKSQGTNPTIGIFSNTMGCSPKAFSFICPRAISCFFQITKFKILLLIAAVIVALSAFYLARSIKGGKLPKGPLSNFLEVLLIYIRDNIARPILGDQPSGFCRFCGPHFCLSWFATCWG